MHVWGFHLGSYCNATWLYHKKNWVQSLNLGGKQPHMRPGWYKRNGFRFVQHMVYQGGVHAGMAKGLKAVCEERFGVEAVIGKI